MTEPIEPVAAPESSPETEETAQGVRLEEPNRAIWQGLPTGLAFGAVAAGVGAFLWFALAWATEREFAYAAIGLGALVGAGVLIGAGRASIPAGLAAVGLSLAGIFAGKLLIVTIIAGSAFEANVDQYLVLSPAEARGLVITDHVYDAQVASGELEPDERWYNAAYVQAEQQAEALDDASALHEAYRLMLEGLLAARAADLAGITLDETTAVDVSYPYYEAARLEVETLDDETVTLHLRGELKRAFDDELEPMAVVTESIEALDLLFAGAAAFVAFGIAGRTKG